MFSGVAWAVDIAQSRIAAHLLSVTRIMNNAHAESASARSIRIIASPKTNQHNKQHSAARSRSAKRNREISKQTSRAKNKHKRHHELAMPRQAYETALNAPQRKISAYHTAHAPSDLAASGIEKPDVARTTNFRQQRHGICSYCRRRAHGGLTSKMAQAW